MERSQLPTESMELHEYTICDAPNPSFHSSEVFCHMSQLSNLVD